MGQAKIEKNNIKVGFFGSDQAGKTQLIQVLSGEKFSGHYKNTMGIGFKSFSPKNGNLEIDIADMGDSRRMDCMIPSYAKQFADLSIICIDQSNADSLDIANTYVEGIRKGNPDTKLIIAVTRTDISPSEITAEDIKQFKIRNKIINAQVIKTSAKNGGGVDNLLESILHYKLEADQNKIFELSSLVTTTIEQIEKLKTVTYNPDDSVAFKALKTLQNELDNPNNSIEEIHSAIDKFTLRINEQILEVEPPEVRSVITRFFQALLSWDKAYFKDTQAEIDEKTRFTNQTDLKKQLTSFKEVVEEVKSNLKPD